MRDETDERVAVVASAQSWVRCRFHHHAAVPNAGIDCAHLLLMAYAGAGLVEPFEPEPYPPDWHKHRDEERFAAKIEEYAKRVGASEQSIAERGPDFRVLPGDILLWKMGRTFSHGAIVSLWPNIIHASLAAGMCLEESCMGGDLEKRPMRVYSYWGS
jgi:cell wall-associated NlpC family hydrolase